MLAKDDRYEENNIESIKLEYPAGVSIVSNSESMRKILKKSNAETFERLVYLFYLRFGPHFVQLQVNLTETEVHWRSKYTDLKPTFSVFIYQELLFCNINMVKRFCPVSIELNLHSTKAGGYFNQNFSPSTPTNNSQSKYLCSVNVVLDHETIR